MKIQSLFLSIIAVFLSAAFLLYGCSGSSNDSQASEATSYVVVAYISGGEGKPLPDFDKVTHLDYAFGRVGEGFNSVDIENPARLRQIAELKNEYNSSHSRQVKMQLSIGGWGSGRFSEMVADSALRHAFVADCKRIVDEYGIDGIDLDWEYPSSGVAGISSSENDIDNFTLWVKELREALGEDRLLTIATISTARFIDFKAVDPYIDFYNIMSYDMAVAPFHHAPLKRFEVELLRDSLMGNLKMGFGFLDYPSDSVVAQQYGQMYQTPVILNADYFRQFASKLSEGETPKESPVAGQCTTEEAVMMHIAAGLDPKKLTLGMPFYGKSGGDANYPFQRQFEETGEPGEGYSVEWDEIAQVPYIADSTGKLVFGFENERSIRSKCVFAKEHGLKGAMYWEYCIDAGRPESFRGRLINSVAEEMLNQ
ncbi:MAG: hypothetical protein IK041_04185 [Bacteroidales bacterium]|nr:hypothetical protein [Bacteroidales bacterium]